MMTAQYPITPRKPANSSARIKIAALRPRAPQQSADTDIGKRIAQQADHHLEQLDSRLDQVYEESALIERTVALDEVDKYL